MKLYVLAVLLSSISLKVYCQCSAGHTVFMGKCVKFHTDKSAWSTARDVCERENGSLFIADEEKYLKALNLTNHINDLDFWIGARQAEQWLWSYNETNTAPHFIKQYFWGNGEPNNKFRLRGTEDAIVLWQWDNFRWNDESQTSQSSQKIRPLCQCQKCRVPREGRSLQTINSKKYFYLRKTECSQLQAQKMCRKYEAELAVIGTAGTQVTIQKRLRKYGAGHSYWTSGQCVNKFFWLNSKPVASMWRAEASQITESCITITSTYGYIKLEASSCKDKKRFICEYAQKPVPVETRTVNAQIRNSSATLRRATTEDCSKRDGYCHENAVCVKYSFGFICVCNAGYTGDGITCTDIDECLIDVDNCDHRATCLNTAGSYICQCDSGFTQKGLDCIDIDECQEDYQNCSLVSSCHNTHGGYTCKCNHGYTGDGYICNDVNECLMRTDYCDNNAACHNSAGGFTCSCRVGFTGDGKTCSDIDECSSSSHLCSGNSKCVNSQGSYSCQCNPGFIGNGTVCTVPECPGNITGVVSYPSKTLDLALLINSAEHWLSFPVGVHQYIIRYPTHNCTTSIIAYDYESIKKRLVFSAKYAVQCDKLTKLTTAVVMSFSQHRYRDINKICGCVSLMPRMSCVNDVLTITWPTNTTVNRSLKKFPENVEMEKRIRSLQVQDGSRFFDMTIVNSVPQLVYPMKDSKGMALKIDYTEVCLDELTFNHQNGLCVLAK